MASTVIAAFDELLSWVIHSETETAAAASHRSSIEACLKANFGMTQFFRAGSYGHGTSLRKYSDVDYFAVIPTNNLKADSAATLRAVKEVLSNRFPNTHVYVDSPAVAVQFGTEAWERHEVTPVDYVATSNGFGVYEMPDRYSGWMKSSPLGLNDYTNIQNNRLNKRAKQLIRLVKLWNYYSGAGIRSIYLELRVAEYLIGESSIIYSEDVMRALRHIQKKELAAMHDPLGLGANISPCTDAVKVSALSKLNTAVSRAEKAVDANNSGKIADAFYWWNMLYSNGFPSYS